MPGSSRMFSFDPRTWPVTVKAPLLVVVLMLVVSIVITDRVLRRLETSQETHLKELASAYMDGLSALVSPHVLPHDTWEVYDALDRAAGRYSGLELMWTTVVTPSGSIIASSQPLTFPADSQLMKAFTERFTGMNGFILAEAEERAHLKRVLTYQDREIGAIYADVGISRLLKERRDVLTTLLLTNLVLTLALAALGYVLVRRMIRPIKILSRYLGHARTGSVVPIPASLMPRSGSEFRRLFERYNDMVRTIIERETLAMRLAEEEKLASLGRLTSGIAHEINNPLGGLFNAIDALKHHGARQDVRRTSISLLERGLAGIRDVVRAALHIYRTDKSPRILTSSDIEDLALLIQPELKRKKLNIDWICDVAGSVPVPTSVRDLALNLLLNACAATPEGGKIGFSITCNRAALELRISDEGAGLPDSAKVYLESSNAGHAPIEERAGLGLWMVRRLADELGASVKVSSNGGRGTSISLAIPLSLAEEVRYVA
jgi:signal transduction histidine kinase